MRRLLGIALVLSLGSLAAWWLLGGSPPPGPVEATDRVTEARPAESARLGSGASADPDGRPSANRLGPKSPRDGRARSPDRVTLQIVQADDETPIEGAQVRTMDGEEAKTDAAGRATVNVMGGTTCLVRRVGYATRWIAVGPTEEIVRVRLTSAPALRGRVVDAATGEPLPGTLIRVARRDLPWRAADAPDPADEAGVFHVAGVPAGSMVELRILGPGFATVVLEAGSPTRGDAPVEVALGRGAVVSGLVRGRDGPVPDADVFVVERGVDLPAPASPWDLEVLAHAVTDSGGRFLVRGLGSPLEVTVVARHRLGSAGRSEALSILHPGIHHEVEIDLTAHGAVVLRLVDAETGERVAHEGAGCSLDRPWTEARDDQKTYLSTPEGDVFFKEVPAGRHRVFVSPDEYLEPAPLDVVVRPAEGSLLTVELERGRTVTGRVVDPRGDPLEVYVSFHASYDGVWQYPNTRTDEDGKFTLIAVPPVPGELSVFEDEIGDRTWKNREIAGDLGELVLVSGPHLVGKLPASMRGATLDCGVNGRRSGGLLDVAEDGAFRIGALEPNEKLTVYLRPEKGAAYVLRDIVLEPGEVRDLGEITFPEALTLEGWVRDAGGVGVRNAFVRLADWWCTSRTHTDAEGRFRLEDLPPGRSTLWIEASSLAVTFHDVDMKSGMAPIEVRLPEPGTVRIRVVREDGTTLPNAPLSVVRLLDTGEPDWERRKILRTKGTGVMEAGLPPGPYVVLPHAAAEVEVRGEAPKVLVVSGRTTEADLLVR